MLDLYWHMECGAYATLTFQHSILPVDSTTFGDDSDFPWHTVIIQYFSWYFCLVFHACVFICDTWIVFDGCDTWTVFDWCETWKRYRNIVSNDFIFMSIYLMATKPRTMKATAMDAFKQKESRDELHPNICIPNAPLYCLTRYWLSQVVVHWVTLCAWRLRRHNNNIILMRRNGNE